MKKIISFSKEISFKTMINKITNLSLEHTLRLNDDNSVSGDFIVEGTYKMTQASQVDENFSYKIPIDISIDSKYNVDNLTIDIESFDYEVVDEEKLLLNISLCLDNMEEKEVFHDIINSDSMYEKLDTIDNVREEKNEILDDLFKETSEEEKLEIPSDNVEITQGDKIQENIDVNKSKNMDSLISILSDDSEVFTTYSVYIVKEDDTIESIQEKYKVNREVLDEYNDLSNINIGSKILIPCVKNE